MANTVSDNRRSINITFDGATAWDYTSKPRALATLTIFLPTSGNVFTLRDGGATGNIITKVVAAANNTTLHFTFPTQALRQLYVVGNEASSGVIALLTY